MEKKKLPTNQDDLYNERLKKQVEKQKELIKRESLEKLKNVEEKALLMYEHNLKMFNGFKQQFIDQIDEANENIQKLECADKLDWVSLYSQYQAIETFTRDLKMAEFLYKKYLE
jgi:hypothetical protein